MILAVDIGNTHILLGGFDEKGILFTELLTTNRHATDLEYASLIETALRVNQLDFTLLGSSFRDTDHPDFYRAFCQGHPPGGGTWSKDRT